MNKNILFIINFLFSISFAWGPNQHYQLGAEIFKDTRLQSLANDLSISYPVSDKSGWCYSTDWSKEPPDDIQHGGWDHISNWATFKSFWGSESATTQRLSQLLHTINDANVPVDHCPACCLFSDANGPENLFEAEAELDNNMPAPDQTIQSVKPEAYYIFEKYYDSFMNQSREIILNHANQYKNSQITVTNTASIKNIYVTYVKSKKCGDFAPCVSLPRTSTTPTSPTTTTYQYVPNINECKSSSIAMGREIVYIWLYCSKNGWDKPPYKDKLKKDISPIVNLLLND